MYEKVGNTQSTKERIVEAADDLFYKKGYEFTSFAHIADEVKISRGNFYHHFKTKDDILNAVISHRMIKTQNMLKEWEEEGKDAEGRIRCFIHILIANYAKIKLYGCPVGTLSTELVKLNHVSKDEANQIFALFRKWLSKQFKELGLKKEADSLAMHLLALSQGVATMATAFPSDAYVKQEVNYMCEWLSQQIVKQSGK
ncbi:TetR/AcrR family transcriptional regulator [Hyphomicrobiales bacterium 4NK60-0047b]